MKVICKGRDAESMAEAIRQAYAEGQEDELLDPIVAVDAEGAAVGPVREGDCVVFYNIRGEREIQLTEALAGKEFGSFARPFGIPARMATMIEYEKNLPVQVAFPPLGTIRNTLGAVLSREGIQQARIVETEKAVHLSFFFNGKVNDPLPLEERIFIPSDKDVTNFDERPEMSADQVASTLEKTLREGACSFVVGNLANVDVVGHLEGEAPVRKAIETVDRCVGRVVEEAGRQGYVTLVTADHGTVEKRLYPDGAIDTGHSDSPVPFVLIPPGGEGKGLRLRQEGSLVDVAPTVLDLFGLPVPEEMTGRSLLEGEGQAAEIRARCKAGPRVLLLILDGWGHLPVEEGNLIATTPTPFMDGWMASCPLDPSGRFGPCCGHAGRERGELRVRASPHGRGPGHPLGPRADR
jgi:2,3-bisphosphoglycerate-independent phosphoglycerate mutase